MANVTIYTTGTCPYCLRAKLLLKEKGVEEIQEIRVDRDLSVREIMIERSGGKRSVPQIFINDQHIGGFEELNQLNREGKLDSLLASSH